MSQRTEVLLSYIAYIVFHEKRPFSYVDLLEFEYEGRLYKTAYGTIRNILSELLNSGEIEKVCRSIRTFYTLKGYKFGKSMTTDDPGMQNNKFYEFLRDLPLERRSIHDIRLRFKVPNIWKLFSINPNFHRIKRSQDIMIPTWSRGDTLIRIIIHRTDTVNIIIGCSLEPIPLEPSGIIHFFNLLVRAEERLQSISDNSILTNHQKSVSIPYYGSWIVTMWHFGRDALIEYTGKGISITVERVEHTLTRLYVKDFYGKKKFRIEAQEYPKKTVLDAINEKLSIASNE